MDIEFENVRKTSNTYLLDHALMSNTVSTKRTKNHLIQLHLQYFREYTVTVVVTTVYLNLIWI